MRIGVAATANVAIPTLNWLRDSEHELELVISQPDRPAGRGREVKASPISLWAIEQNISLLRAHSPHEFIGAIEDLDLVLTIGYGVLLPQAILDLPRHGFLNLHFSLLPAYRGAAPAQRAIENGEEITGVTVFALDKGMDTGPIYTTVELAIAQGWRSQELLPALAALGPEAVSAAFSAIENGDRPYAQTGSASLAPKIRKEDGEIDWKLDAEIVSRRIRAFYPAPGAWSTWGGDTFKVTRAHACEADLSVGEVRVIDGDVKVGCAKGTALTLVTLIPAGKKEMDARDWLRGLRISPGAHFG